MSKNYHWQWADTYFGGRNIDIFEGREHIATVFTEDNAKRIITAMREEGKRAVKNDTS